MIHILRVLFIKKVFLLKKAYSFHAPEETALRGIKTALFLNWKTGHNIHSFQRNKNAARGSGSVIIA